MLIKSSHEQGEDLSTAFFIPKKDRNHRLTLNSNVQLNKLVSYHHFKMESLKHVVSMVRPNCLMASVDLKDAYYSVPTNQDHQKSLNVSGMGSYYQITCLPNRLACAPRLFTQLLKPAYSTLRKQGFQSVGYIDDS